MQLRSVFRQETTFLLLLFIVSFGVRACVYGFFLADKKILTAGDSAAYHAVASNIARGNGFTSGDTPHFRRLPGYPTFLALCYRLISFKIPKALWGQVILACLIPLLIFFLSLVLIPGNVVLAKVVGLIAAVHLGLVLFSGLAMSESLFTLFFLFFCIGFFASFKPFFSSRKTKCISDKTMLMTGVALGCASLVRPVGHYLIVLAIGLLLCSNDVFTIKIRKSALLFCGWLLIVVWWLLRNGVLTGHLFFHTLPGVHFLRHTAARLAMERDKSTYAVGLKKVSEEWKRGMRFQANRKGRPLNEIERCKIAEGISWRYSVANPFLAMRHALVNMLKTAFSLYSGEILFIDSGGKLPSYERSRGLRDMLRRFLMPQVSHWALAMVIYGEILFFLLLIIGWCGFMLRVVWSPLHRDIAWIVVPFMGIFIGMSLACGFARLRFPVEPLALIMSCAFWLDVVLNRKRWLYG